MMKKKLMALLIFVLSAFTATFAVANVKDLNKNYSDLYNRKKTDKPVTIREKGRFAINLNKVGLNIVSSQFLLQVASQGEGQDRVKAIQLLSRTSADLKLPLLLSSVIDPRLEIKGSAKSQINYLQQLADYHIDRNELVLAQTALRRVLAINPRNYDANYTLGLVELMADRPDEAAKQFRVLLGLTEKSKEASKARNLAILSMGRAYYQSEKFLTAAKYYLRVPKDSSLYPGVAQELSWSLFRAGNFRSALGAIQTVHNPYFDSVWHPEVHLLRSILLLYLCQVDEAEATLALFDKAYWPVYSVLKEMENQDVLLRNELFRGGKDQQLQDRLPLYLVNTVKTDPKLQQYLKLIRQIKIEQRKLAKIAGLDKRLRNFSRVALKQALEKTEKQALEIFKSILLAKSEELLELKTQHDFILLEVLRRKKTQVENRMLAKNNKFKEKFSRKVLIEDGYRLWPASQEVWRDEVGNYHYFGGSVCE